jgi:hypothetical protein
MAMANPYMTRWYNHKNKASIKHCKIVKTSKNTDIENFLRYIRVAQWFLNFYRLQITSAGQKIP